MYNILVDFCCKECGCVCQTSYNGYCARCYIDSIKADNDREEEQEYGKEKEETDLH